MITVERLTGEPGAGLTEWFGWRIRDAVAVRSGDRAARNKPFTGVWIPGEDVGCRSKCLDKKEPGVGGGIAHQAESTSMKRKPVNTGDLIESNLDGDVIAPPL